MTAPALADEQLAQLKVLMIYPAAFTYHEAVVPQEEQIDLAVAFLVHGDLRLVAADVLQVACQHASAQQADLGPSVKRFRIEGDYEEEYFPGLSGGAVQAEAWCARAEALRSEVTLAGRSGLLRSPVAGMVSGANPVPVFTVARRSQE